MQDVELWVDRGGTFTDCVVVVDGQVRVRKLLSTDDAPVRALRDALALAPTAPLPPCRVRLGTTLATNALLERKIARCALVVTKGFADLVLIGTQQRPELFALSIERPPPLHDAVVEIDARAAPDGRVLQDVDDDDVERALRDVRARGIESVAIAVLHGHRAPALERRVGAIARRVGFTCVALSSDQSAEPGLLARTETALVDAAATPVLARYVAALARAFAAGARLSFMTSSGGLVDGARFKGPAAILSGPAGGIVAARVAAAQAGAARAVGVDMGGTSTDVCVVTAGDVDAAREREVAGVRVRAPMLPIHTVAAGGGSLCRFDGARFTVGPESAGSSPGPLCYGRAEAVEPTMTDVDLVAGRLVGDRFPFPLDEARARRALEDLRARIAATGVHKTVDEIAAGFRAVAAQATADAVRQVCLETGEDPRAHALVVFGGAAGQHACAVARRLGATSVLVPPLSGVLSAWGIGHAPIVAHAEAEPRAADGSTAAVALDQSAVDALDAIVDDLRARAAAVAAAEAREGDVTVATGAVDLRYAGTETSLTVPFDGRPARSAPSTDERAGAAAESDPASVAATSTAASLRAAFEAKHAAVFGYARPDHPIEIVVARAHATSSRPSPAAVPRPPATSRGAPRRTVRFVVDDGARAIDAPLWWREDLAVGAVIAGPAIVADATSTLALEPGFAATVLADGTLRVEDRAPAGAAASPGGDAGAVVDVRADPISLELFDKAFVAVAEEMGDVLRRTAISTNIRERLDFSCAVFDGRGGLVANAPHIPVHLGAMSESVRSLLEEHPRPARGDVYVTNDPRRGGSHLPDVTVIAPVHGPADDEPLFFVASRGHHSDVGGITPGSMPPFATTLAEEGVVLPMLRAVREGRLDERALRDALGAGPWPARDPKTNVADVEAMIAANQAGAARLLALAERRGVDVVRAYMGHVQRDAARAVEEALRRAGDGRRSFADALDDGTPVVVAVDVAGGRARIDFTGTGPAVRGNLNAPRAVVVAAVLYVLRLLVGKRTPLSSGMLAPIDLVLPPGSLVDPPPGAAVAGGNVETSMRVVDVLLGAFGLCAASQGTMNNLTLGDETFGYYETIAGGAGAGDGFVGASGVHTHMTNTRITDPEILESRFPLRLLRFALRRGSGGAGRFAGGDGVVREIEARAPLQVSILSERRARAPFGLQGGGDGARGRNLVNGVDVGGKAVVRMKPGDVVTIETPGGGGYGA